MAKLLSCDCTKAVTITPRVGERPADPLTPARVLRLSFFTLMFLMGAVMLLLRIFYESREGFTSKAESSGIPTGLIGGAVVFVSGAMLLADVVVILVYIARRSPAPSEAVDAANLSSSTVASSGEFLSASVSFTKSQ
ncbi:hypothetical protein V5799_008079 [Amblyomma americanum]|uniref:Uncharacterized protein n=1 Tax=Amblyomma americanum TaxID=6943 RepID=A0AAQ4FF46_AMBAM